MADSLYVFRWLLVSCVTVDAVWAQCILTAPVELNWLLTNDSISSELPFMAGEMTTKTVADISYFDNHFCIGEHTGTHMDAPLHFNSKGWAIDEIPDDRFLANGAFLDVSADVAAKDPKGDFRLTKDYIDKWVQRNGDFPDNTVLLIKFGWFESYGHPMDFFGTQEYPHMKNGNWPGLDPDVARHLAGMGQIVGVGVDVPSIEPPGQGEIHSIFAASNLYNLEYLSFDSHCLPESEFKVHALPVYIQKGTGAPVRVIAMPDLNFDINKNATQP